jgi:hypothetical protein
MQANYGETEIKSILQKVRIFRKEIGPYQAFAITEKFDYIVKLTNGSMLLKFEDLQNDERDLLTPNRLAAIAESFVLAEELQKTEKKAAASDHLKSDRSTTLQKDEWFKKPVVIVVIILVVILGAVSILPKINFSGKGALYTAQIMTIEEIELSKPTDFLSASGTYRENFWGTKLKVDCVITNKATVATYKDAVVKVTYFTKTKTAIGNSEHIVYEVFPPSSKKTVGLKLENYKDVHSISWKVISAEAY